VQPTKLPRFVTLSQAAACGEFPWQDAEAFRRAQRNARPRRDSVGRLVSEGDPDLASCFVRPGGKLRGPLAVDTRRLAEVLERRRLAPPR
jgi:hypothetical protein